MFYHPRDDRIKFEEIPHKYYVDDKECSYSVTTFISFWLGKFDKEKIYKNIKSRPANRQGRYKNMNKIEMFKDFDKSTKNGTIVHNWIEDFYKTKKQPTDKTHHLYKHWERFIKYHKKTRLLYGWIRKNSDPEHIIYATIKKKDGTIMYLPGMVDNLTYQNVMETSEKIYIMEDWKVVRNINFEDKNKKLPYPFQNHTYSKHLKNSLQLHIYNYILEKYYSNDNFPYKHKKLYNIYFCDKYKNIVKKEATDLRKEVEIMFDMLKNDNMPNQRNKKRKINIKKINNNNIHNKNKRIKK